MRECLGESTHLSPQHFHGNLGENLKSATEIVSDFVKVPALEGSLWGVGVGTGRQNLASLSTNKENKIGWLLCVNINRQTRRPKALRYLIDGNSPWG